MSSNPYQTRDENQLRLAIKEEQVSVAPANEARIQIAVINDGPSEEDVNILIKGVPAEWISIDLPIVHLAPGEARQVIVTVQPPPVPESRVGQYTVEIHAVSRSDANRSAVAHTMLTVAAYESRGRIGVLLGALQYPIVPGSTVHIPILLQNRGLEEDTFRLSIAGIPSNWISTNSALTRLEPSASKEIMVTIHVPRSPQASAGRMPFVIQFTSQVSPDQRTDVDCILTISAFSQFSAFLEPATMEGGQFGQLIVNNEGNTVDTFSLIFQSPGNGLIFEKVVQVARPGPQPGTQRVETGYVEIPQGDRFQIAAGERGVYPFRARLRARPIIGGVQSYPFTVSVTSTEKRVHELPGQLDERGFIPIWLLSALVAGSLILCLLLLIPLRNLPTAARATQTASFNQTQAALAGQQDSDGDGLTDTEEAGLGTDSFIADTDEDELLDGEEVESYQTNPLVADTDDDGLLDGEEVRDHETDPRNPDMDADLLNDGDEIERDTDPKVADTDQDGVADGAEVSFGTDPRQQDTDRDQLLDGQENQTCPRPLTPDSDADGIIDGNDAEPCNASNPALTATAIAGAPTQAPPTQAQPTQVQPTQVQPTAVIPTLTPLPSATSIPPTLPPAATLTPAPPSLQGFLLFGSNRDGNSEIYALDLANQSLTRLTANAAQDIQPALAPDSARVAYVSNQDGNNEIYVGGIDRRVPLNLTNHAADDQQPTWSPDGNWIAFTTNRDGNQEIYVIRSDGSQVRNLTSNAANDFAPTWFSVSGLFGSEEWIAFTSTRDGNQEIYKVRPDGTGLTNLTQNPANDYAPSGLPGGQTLAFVTERDGNPEIYTMNQNGGAATNVTNHPARDLEPAIGSNGNWIAFSTDREGNLEVYVVRTQGGTSYNLTRNPGQERDPDW
jgi:Tol biopolymer transport system component